MMTYDLNKEIDKLFEELKLFGLSEQDAIDVFAIILYSINKELKSLRGCL